MNEEKEKLKKRSYEHYRNLPKDEKMKKINYANTKKKCLKQIKKEKKKI